MMNYHSKDKFAELSGTRGTNGAGRACDSLCRVLREGIDIHRCLAAQALGGIAHPESVGTLVDALLDEDADVRVDAAKALRRIPDPRAAKQLFENLLGDPCSDVKLYAIEALARSRHPELAPWLRRMLKGRDEGVVWDDEEFYADGWDGWIDIQTKAIEALAELGADDAVADIVAALDDEFGQDLTEVGFKALARLGDRGIVALARNLDNPSERRRRRAAAALAGVDTEAAHEAVVRALRDPSMNVRFAAARALAARNPADRRLALLFRDARPEVRAEIVRICGREHPGCIAALLDDKAPAVRRAVLDIVADAPALLPAGPVVDRASAWLDGADADLAAAAAVALAAVDPSAAADILVVRLADTERPLAARLGAIKGLAGIGCDTVMRALAGVVGDDQRQLRIEAMTALATLAAGDEARPNVSCEILLAALRGELVRPPADDVTTDAGIEPTPEPSEPSEAAPPTSTLESILDGQPRKSPPPVEDSEGPELTPEDIELLALSKRTPRAKHVPVTPQIAPHQDVRRLAARVLGDVAREEVARALAESLRDGDEDVRRPAADSLARIADNLSPLPDDVVAALLDTLTTSDRDMRLSIVRALGAVGDQATATALIGCLGDEDSFVRAEAVRALSRNGAGATEIEALLGDTDPAVRVVAARAVATAGGAKAVDRLVDLAFAFGGQHRREAGRLLRGLDTAKATARLLDTLDDGQHQKSWQIAIEALEELHRSDIAVAGKATAQT